MATVYVRGKTPEQVRAIVLAVADAVAGRGAAYADLARGLRLRVATVLLSLVQEDFLKKAQGGGGVAGDPWAPLAESTVRRRRFPGHGTVGRARRAAKEGLVRAGKRLARARRPEERRKAKLAYEKAKAKVAAAYGAVEILRDTGRLFNSLSPGLQGKGDQVLEDRAGEVLVGTNVKYAKFHQTGTRRMPRRRLWPEPSRWPADWHRQMAEAARSGMVQALTLVLGG